MAVQPLPVNATANASGIALATYPQFTPGQRRVVSQVSVLTTSTVLTPTAKLIQNSLLISSTQNPVDSAVGEPFVSIGAHDTLQVQWTGCDVGALCTAIFFWDREA